MQAFTYRNYAPIHRSTILMPFSLVLLQHHHCSTTFDSSTDLPSDELGATSPQPLRVGLLHWLTKIRTGDRQIDENGEEIPQNDRNIKVSHVSKPLHEGQDVYIDHKPMTTSGNSDWRRTIYCKPIAESMGSFIVIEVSLSMVTIRENKIRNIVATNRATMMPLMRKVQGKDD